MITIGARNFGAHVLVDDDDSDLADLVWSYDRGFFRNGSAGALHRVIAERKLGRKLIGTEIVRCANGFKHDCTRANITITTRAAVLQQRNAKKHRAAKRQRPDLVSVIQRRAPDCWRVLRDGSIHTSEGAAVTHLESIGS